MGLLCSLLSLRTAKEGFSEGTQLQCPLLFWCRNKEDSTISISSILRAIIARKYQRKSCASNPRSNRFERNSVQLLLGFSKWKNSRNSRTTDDSGAPLYVPPRLAISMKKTSVNTNLSYQFGKIGNSRIDNTGSRVLSGAPDGSGKPLYC